MDLNALQDLLLFIAIALPEVQDDEDPIFSLQGAIYDAIAAIEVCLNKQ